MRISDAFIQTGGVDALKKATGAAKVESKNSTPAREHKDTVSISSQARHLSDNEATKQSAQIRAESLPEVRQERIAAVKERIASGYYNSEEFKDALADRLMKDFGLNQV